MTNVIASFLLVIISAYYANSTLFSHTHVIEGATIVHSHFFGEEHGDSPDGGHTQNEITLIQYINSGVLFCSTSITIAEQYSECEYRHYIPTSFAIISAELYLCGSPRAPPIIAA